MQTAVSALQELSVKLKSIPNYECIGQTGPTHGITFEYRCTVLEEVATASGPSKKQAKHEVARVMLLTLSERGHKVPSPFDKPLEENAESPMVTNRITRSYVTIIKEICDHYHLTPVEYELVGDTGPAHLRQFTVKARLGLIERMASSTSKKRARNLVAEELYTYLKHNLTRLSEDFDEMGYLVRRQGKGKKTPDSLMGGPDIKQHVSEYQEQLIKSMDKNTIARTQKALRNAESCPPLRSLMIVAKAMKIEVWNNNLPREIPSPLHVVELRGYSPDLIFSGTNITEAAENALNFIKSAFTFAEPKLPNVGANKPTGKAKKPAKKNKKVKAKAKAEAGAKAESDEARLTNKPTGPVKKSAKKNKKAKKTNRNAN